MQIQTVLNQVHKFKSFGYGEAVWRTSGGRIAVEIEMKARANGNVLCGVCGSRSPAYDRQPLRRFEFVPIWGVLVFFLYAPRRVKCARCGVRVEELPWAEGKNHLTTAYQWFLSTWAKRLSWKEVATAFHTSWENVYRSVDQAVTWGLARRSLEGITALGIDEVMLHKGKYMTVVYQIDAGCKRLLWMGADRTEATLHRFFDLLGQARSSTLKFICTDMWRAYLSVIKERAGQALNILDRFHIAKLMNVALDEIRAHEVRELSAKGYMPVLKHARWCLAKKPENLTGNQAIKLAELLQLNLKSIRAYLLKEEFQLFWDYLSPVWARKFLTQWRQKVMRSRLEPMKRVAKTLKTYEALLLNFFEARGNISLGAVEGLNNKLKLVSRKSFGFRTQNVTETALYHALGDLPSHEFAHRFC